MLEDVLEVKRKMSLMAPVSGSDVAIEHEPNDARVEQSWVRM